VTQASVLRASVLLAAMASVGLIVVFARLYSALLGAETAPWAPGLALLGAGLGAMGAGLAGSRLGPPRLVGGVGALLGLASFATIVAAIAVLRLAPPEGAQMAATGRLIAVAALTVLPFAAVGAATAAALAHSRADAPRVAAFDLTGSAAAIPVAVALLRGAGAPRAALVLAVLLAVAGLLAALGGHAATRGRSGRPALGWGFLVGALAVLGGDLGAPWMRLTYTRGARADRAELVAWSELGLVTADVPARGGTAWIHSDGVGTSAVVSAATEPPKHPDQMGWAMPDARGPVLVVGAGGGREVRAALAAGQDEIYATEVDRVVVDRAVRGVLREHAGDVYDRPEVKLVVTDARGYAARNEASFRTIVSSATDTGAAGPAGTLVRAESGLYTVEAIAAFLRALTPEGTLVVNRWDPEAERLVALLAAGLRATGVDSPRGHLFACSHQRATTVLAARRPLDDDAITALRAFCKRGKFKEVLAPDRALRAELGPMADDPSAPAAVVDRDVSPPTDDRPFWFHGVARGRAIATLTSVDAMRREPLFASAALLTALGALALLVLVFAAVAGGRGGESRLYRDAPRGIAFFVVAGAGYAVVQSALLQRLAIFVAHPAHALLVVLLALLVGAAVGAVTVRGVSAVALVATASRRALVLAIVLACLSLVLGPLLDAVAGLPAAARALVAVVVCAPLGVLAGGIAPLAVRALASWSPARAALAAGVGGGAALLGTGAATLLALHAGLSFLLLAAAALYLAAGVLVPRPSHARA
jgi:hypothetical protein